VAPTDRALLIAMPLRHLESAAQTGATTLPAGGPGDLDTVPAGLPVVVIATDAGDAEVPAATWRATFVARVPYEPGDPYPEGIPPTWRAEHGDAPAASPAAADPPTGADDADDDDEDGDLPGPQSFLAVTDLAPLPRSAWLFANELVGKQARGGRTFRPREPTLVTLPD
jgi:hypothetical protein